MKIDKVRIRSICSLATVIYAGFLSLGGMAKIHAALPLGVNLQGNTEEQGSAMFNDLMKGARPWGTPSLPYAGDANVDANGWPTEDCGTLFLAYDTIPPGIYKLKFTGKATTIECRNCNAKAQNVVHDETTKITTADIVVPLGETSLLLNFIGTNGGLKDLTLFRPGLPATNPPEFYAPFLKALEPFSVVRAMDIFTTNNTEPPYPGVTEWSSVRPYNYASTRNYWGMKKVIYQDAPNYRYLTDLGNAAGKDIWINVPVAATDDYVTKLAALLKENLNPDRAVYIEYSNEVWNYGFTQAHWNLSAAQVEVANGDTTYNADKNDNKWYWAQRRVAKRSWQIAKIFASVWGQQAMKTRVRVVMPEPGLIQYDFLARYYDPHPEFLFYSISFRAPYMGTSENMPAVTKAQMLSQMRNYSDSTNRHNNKALAIAAIYYNVKPITYEGGPSLAGSDFVNEKVAANRDPAMEDLVYHDLYDNWYGVGGGLYCYYNLVGGFGKYGSWGSMERYGDLDISPKFKALKRVASATPPVVALPATNVPPIGQSVSVSDSEAVWAKGIINIRTISKESWEYAGFLFKSNGRYTANFSVKYSSYRDSLGMEFLVNNRTAVGVPAPNANGVNRWTTPVAITLDSGFQVVRINITGPAGNGVSIDSVKLSTVSGVSLSVPSVLRANIPTSAQLKEGRVFNLAGKRLAEPVGRGNARMVIRKGTNGKYQREVIPTK